jgi:hypothetical protein
MASIGGLGGSSGRPPPSETLFVADLGPEVNLEMIQAGFDCCPGYVSHRMRRDRGGSQVAFVEFSSVDLAVQAREQLNGVMRLRPQDPPVSIHFARHSYAVDDAPRSKRGREDEGGDGGRSARGDFGGGGGHLQQQQGPMFVGGGGGGGGGGPRATSWSAAAAAAAAAAAGALWAGRRTWAAGRRTWAAGRRKCLSGGGLLACSSSSSSFSPTTSACSTLSTCCRSSPCFTPSSSSSST